MTALIRIAGGALAVFLVLGGIQEWRSLAAPLLPPERRLELSQADRRAAAATVYRFVQLSSHLYATGGDRRFAERLPSSPALIDEIVRDARYVLHNERVQEPSLMRLDIASIESPSPDVITVGVKEYWTTRYYFKVDHSFDAVRSDVVLVQYRLQRDAGSWRVMSWDPKEPA